nr:unnamed protein product [Spirometra erinaceieuropaei]
MDLHLFLRRSSFTIFISAYAASSDYFWRSEDKFFKDLHTLLASVPKADKLVFLFGFTALIGTDRYLEESVGSPKESVATANMAYLFRKPAQNSASS